MKIVAIIQARMGSSRLPGKVLLRVGGHTMLQMLVERLRRAPSIDEVAIATTTEPADAAIADHAAELGVTCVRGSERDVLQRFADTARATAAELVVRLTADSPLLDPEILEGGLRHFHAQQPSADYQTTGTDTFPLGLGFEIVTAEALCRADREARAEDEREHVTPYIKRHPEVFRVVKFSHPESLTHHRWTLDTPEDFDLIRRMLEVLPPDFGLRDCLAVIAAHPEWAALNAQIQQVQVA